MKKILLFILSFLVTVAAAAAQVDLPEDCQELTAFNHQQIIKCETATKLAHENNVLIQKHVKLLAAVDETSRQTVTTDMGDSLKSAISSITKIMALLVVVYTGFLFIESSSDPEKRDHAKEQLKNIVIFAIALVCIGYVMTTGEIIGHNAATMIGNQFTPPNPAVTETTYDGIVKTNAELQSITSSFTLAANSFLFSLSARHTLIATLRVLAPLLLLLMFFRPTRAFGMLFAIVFAIELFIPAISLIILRAADTLFISEAASAFVKMQAITTALFLATVAHIALIATAVAKAVR